MENNPVTITKRIDNEKIREQIWKIYEQSFAGKEVECVQNQKCYNRDSFLNALTDPDYYKYYILVDGKIVAYMLSTANLQKASITYMNPERYFHLFSEFAPDRIYYCTSLAVITGMRSQRYFYRLMSVYLENVLANLSGMHAFDFSHETIPNLPYVLMKMGEKLYKEGKLPKRFVYTKVGAQEFGALIPEKPPDQKNTTG